MLHLRLYLNSLSVDDQHAYAHRCRTTVGYLRKALSINQTLNEGLCILLDRESSGAVPMELVRPDVDWAYVRSTTDRANDGKEHVSAQEAIHG